MLMCTQGKGKKIFHSHIFIHVYRLTKCMKEKKRKPFKRKSRHSFISMYTARGCECACKDMCIIKSYKKKNKHKRAQFILCVRFDSHKCKF